MDANCIRYSGSYCSSCKPMFYLKSFICVTIDKSCIKFNYELNICNSCTVGKKPDGAICKWLIYNYKF